MKYTCVVIFTGLCIQTITTVIITNNITPTSTPLGCTQQLVAGTGQAGGGLIIGPGGNGGGGGGMGLEQAPNHMLFIHGREGAIALGYMPWLGKYPGLQGDGQP